jgi:hypothetical protein
VIIEIAIEIAIEIVARGQQLDPDFDCDFEEARQPDATSQLDSSACIWCPQAI